MKARTIAGAIAVCAIIALTTTAVFAAIVLVPPPGTNTPKGGATTITWDSSFEDLNYTLGNTITFTVNWDVNAGAASYKVFSLKLNPKGKGGFTPRGNDPAAGQVIHISGSNPVTVQFKFTDLHLDKKRNVEIGNAHFKLYLEVDVDGDGTPETDAGFGVNVHVEDPQ